MLVYTTKTQQIAFDEYTHDEEYNSYWVTVCSKCLAKFGDAFGNRVDEYGSGCCSVMGCAEEDGDDAEMHYIDFSDLEVDEYRIEKLPSGWYAVWLDNSFLLDAACKTYEDAVNAALAFSKERRAYMNDKPRKRGAYIGYQKH